jgi:hypothetical protein
VTRWPRMMKARTAAEYCDLSESAFQGEVLAGRLPAPIMLGGREHWCQVALDRALAILTGEQPLPEWEQELNRKYG